MSQHFPDHLFSYSVSQVLSSWPVLIFILFWDVLVLYWIIKRPLDK